MDDSLWSHDYVRVSKLLIPNLGKIFLGMWSAKKEGWKTTPLSGSCTHQEGIFLTMRRSRFPFKNSEIRP